MTMNNILTSGDLDFYLLSSNRLYNSENTGEQFYNSYYSVRSSNAEKFKYMFISAWPQWEHFGAPLKFLLLLNTHLRILQKTTGQ